MSEFDSSKGRHFPLQKQKISANFKSHTSHYSRVAAEDGHALSSCGTKSVEMCTIQLLPASALAELRRTQAIKAQKVWEHEHPETVQNEGRPLRDF